MIARHASGPSHQLARELVRRSAAVAVAMLLIHVILPTLVHAAG